MVAFGSAKDAVSISSKPNALMCACTMGLSETTTIAELEDRFGVGNSDLH